MIRYLESLEGVDVHMAHEVQEIKKQSDGCWQVITKNLTTSHKQSALANLVF